MIFRTVVMSTLLALVGCSTVPAPTLQVSPNRPFISAEGLVAPRQKAWQWDADRSFDAEVDRQCWGHIHFVDQTSGIDAFVGEGSPPNITLDSDDANVILANVVGFNPKRLVFSTDGGRHFYKEVRGFPLDFRLHFVAVRRGHVYVGFDSIGQPDDGYFKWQQYRQPVGSKDTTIVETKLIVMVARLDKSQGRIGTYKILVPDDYQFVNGIPSYAASYITRTDDIDALDLPRREALSAREACKTTMSLPPYDRMLTPREKAEYLDWYEATKEAHPDWADAQKESYVDRVVRQVTRAAK